MIKIYTEEQCHSGLFSSWGIGIVVIRQVNHLYDKPYQCIGTEKKYKRFVQHSNGKIDL